jgi:hypothetical protein
MGHINLENIKTIKLGGQAVNEIFHGAVKVWPTTVVSHELRSWAITYANPATWAVSGGSRTGAAANGSAVYIKGTIVKCETLNGVKTDIATYNNVNLVDYCTYNAAWATIGSGTIIAPNRGTNGSTPNNIISEPERVTQARINTAALAAIYENFSNQSYVQDYFYQQENKATAGSPQITYEDYGFSYTCQRYDSYVYPAPASGDDTTLTCTATRKTTTTTPYSFTSGSSMNEVTETTGSIDNTVMTVANSSPAVGTYYKDLGLFSFNSRGTYPGNIRDTMITFSTPYSGSNNAWVFLYQQKNEVVSDTYVWSNLSATLSAWNTGGSSAYYLGDYCYLTAATASRQRVQTYTSGSKVYGTMENNINVLSQTEMSSVSGAGLSISGGSLIYASNLGSGSGDENVPARSGYVSITTTTGLSTSKSVSQSGVAITYQALLYLTVGSTDYTTYEFPATGGSGTLKPIGITYHNGVEYARVTLSATYLSGSDTTYIKRSGTTVTASNLNRTEMPAASTTYSVSWKGKSGSITARQEANVRYKYIQLGSFTKTFGAAGGSTTLSATKYSTYTANSTPLNEGSSGITYSLGSASSAPTTMGSISGTSLSISNLLDTETIQRTATLTANATGYNGDSTTIKQAANMLTVTFVSNDFDDYLSATVTAGTQSAPIAASGGTAKVNVALTRKETIVEKYSYTSGYNQNQTRYVNTDYNISSKIGSNYVISVNVQNTGYGTFYRDAQAHYEFDSRGTVTGSQRSTQLEFSSQYYQKTSGNMSIITQVYQEKNELISQTYLYRNPNFAIGNWTTGGVMASALGDTNPNITKSCERALQTVYTATTVTSSYVTVYDVGIISVVSGVGLSYDTSGTSQLVWAQNLSGQIRNGKVRCTWQGTDMGYTEVNVAQNDV